MLEIPHTIERTRNRNSRATIQNGSVLIRLAKNLSASEEQRHINLLLKRMTKAFLREKQRIRLDPFSSLLCGAFETTVHLVTGESVRFEITEGARARTTKTRNGWRVMTAPHAKKSALHAHLWRLLAKSCATSVRSLVRGINAETLNADITSVTLKMMRSRWGSCGRRGQISLSTPLLLTSQSILRYVIIHELSHMPHPNHSDAFWRTVETFMPDYRAQVKDLKRFALPNHA